MPDEELIESFNEFSISESEFEKGKKILQGAKGSTTEGIYDCLTKSSQVPKLSNSLFVLLTGDIGRFLEGLKELGDFKAIILINVIKTNSTKESTDDLTLTIMNITSTLLKRSEVSDTKFWLSLYFSVLSNFNVSNPQHLSILLSFLTPLNEEKDEKLAHEIYSLVLVITIKYLELQSKESTEIITNYLEMLTDDKPGEIPLTSFLNLVKSLELLFPVISSISSTIYMSDNCKEIILHQANKISTSSLDYTSNKLLTTQILKLVGSSCINDQCRSFNNKNYLELLKVGTKVLGDSFVEIRLLSVLGIIKLWNFIQLEKENSSKFKVTISDLSDCLIEYLRNFKSINNKKYLEYCIEGLAYLSLNVSVKKRLRNDETLIENLVSILSENTHTKESNENPNTSLILGLLLILSNLAKLKEINSTSQEKKTINELKNFSTPNSQEQESENQDEIHCFNKNIVMNHKIIEIISRLKIYKGLDFNKSNLLNQLISILYMVSLNQDKSVRQELIKQGALNVLLDYLITNSVVAHKSSNTTRPINQSEEAIEIRLYGLRSLAKILISVNPALAFKKYDIKTCLPFLVELLGPDISQYTGLLNNGEDKYLYDQISKLDKYEALLALTNISAVSSNESSPNLKQVIVSKIFDKYLDNFIIDTDVPEIQKASWELISNLIMEPTLLVKFFNIEKIENLNRLKLLIKLLNSTDESFQIIIGGLLANATSEFEMISQVLIENEEINTNLIEILSNIFESQFDNDELLLRACYILLSLVYSATKLEAKYLNKLSENKSLKNSLTCALRSTKNREIMQMIIEIIKLIKFK